jgi:hypothetical protein
MGKDPTLLAAVSDWAGQPPPGELSPCADGDDGGDGLDSISPAPMSPLSPSAGPDSPSGGGGGGEMQLIARISLAGIDWSLSAADGPQLAFADDEGHKERAVLVCAMLFDEEGSGGTKELQAQLSELVRRGRAGYAWLGQVILRGA